MKREKAINCSTNPCMKDKTIGLFGDYTEKVTRSATVRGVMVRGLSGRTDADSRKSAVGKKSFASVVATLHLLSSSSTMQTNIFFIPIIIRSLLYIFQGL